MSGFFRLIWPVKRARKSVPEMDGWDRILFLNAFVSHPALQKTQIHSL